MTRELLLKLLDSDAFKGERRGLVFHLKMGLVGDDFVRPHLAEGDMIVTCEWSNDDYAEWHLDWENISNSYGTGIVTELVVTNAQFSWEN